MNTEIERLRWAAEQGDAFAQNDCGLIHATGKGVPRDYQEAAKWYRLAAEQGDALAQYNLGFRYSKGRGVPQDYVQAHKWLNLAASRMIVVVALMMTAPQVAEAQRLAREWQPKTWEQLKDE